MDKKYDPRFDSHPLEGYWVFLAEHPDKNLLDQLRYSDEVTAVRQYLNRLKKGFNYKFNKIPPKEYNGFMQIKPEDIEEILQDIPMVSIAENK
jgi:hypothetical protein